MKYLIAFGANIGDREKTVEQARRSIESDIGSILQSSSHYTTEPLLPPGALLGSQEKYLNGVLLVESDFEPLVVLQKCLAIEKCLGRIRTVRWGSRIIDLDIIACDNIIFSSPELTIPHAEMFRREFVLTPLCEICPEWMHPCLKKTARELLVELQASQKNLNS